MQRLFGSTPPPRKLNTLDTETLATVQEIIGSVEREGEQAVRRYSETFGEIAERQSLWVTTAEMEAAFDTISSDDQVLLIRVANRIRSFAESQYETLSHLSLDDKTSSIGHRWIPIDRAGCYAPGGRYPLPSSVLMTVIPADVAGVPDIVLASPRPATVTLAAAHVAGARRMLRIGGAQAIAAFAYGIGDMEPRDIVVGPGNRYVTAAKKQLFGIFGIDSLAGPSELLIIADDSARPDWVAADLLAQAEHDEDAVTYLVTTSEDIASYVEEEIRVQLSTLPTAATAEISLRNGFIILVDSIDEAISMSNDIAPEHLELHLKSVPEGLRNYGTLFENARSAEVFGDYGFGPNHTLPTGGAARFSAGLSVFHFLKAQTFMNFTKHPDPQIIDDTARFARIEGLEAHARAAEIRR